MDDTAAKQAICRDLSPAAAKWREDRHAIYSIQMAPVVAQEQ
jgi:hypothetical protein